MFLTFKNIPSKFNFKYSEIVSKSVEQIYQNFNQTEMLVYFVLGMLCYNIVGIYCILTNLFEIITLFYIYSKNVGAFE